MPSLTVLNFSGGRQSSALLWMVLRGDIPLPPNRFMVLTADPGMENQQTYSYIDMMFAECKKAGIEAHKVPGPNLYQDLLASKNQKTMANPPYWTKNKHGGIGKLMHKCTYTYKIAPMDRFLRGVLAESYNIPRNRTRLAPSLIEKWIGFSFDEVVRVKPSRVQHIYFRYPLIEKRMSNKAVMTYFEANKLPIPPRSACNACFANGLKNLKAMYEKRPKGWAQAVAVDEAIRDWSNMGVENEVYVFRGGVPLKDLPDLDFDLANLVDDADDYSCDSGYCFV